MCCYRPVPLLKEKVNLLPPVCYYYFQFKLRYHQFSFHSSRKLRVKRSIKVPAISNKIADIPPDEYSWRKYGQKPIKGSPHPRYVLKCD